MAFVNMALICYFGAECGDLEVLKVYEGRQNIPVMRGMKGYLYGEVGCYYFYSCLSNKYTGYS
jgi:hypothetical protein